MILSDKDIKKAWREKRIIIEPFEEALLQPASIDLRLGNRFLIFDKANFSAIDVRKPLDNFMKETSIGGDKPFILHPGEFALGVIHEWVGVGHDMVGRLEGKSSLGRLGLIVHATAGFLDPGNCLHMTLELHNLGNLPIMLYHMMPIAQLAFMPLSSACEIPYGDARRSSKYFNDHLPQASQMYRNFTQSQFKPPPSLNS